jgi:glucose/arabinose dehydrogenase
LARIKTAHWVVAAAALLFGCSDGSAASSRSSASADSRFALVPGFSITRIASVRGARELAILPNGDLLIGTSGTSIDILPHPEADEPDGAHVFTKLSEGPAAGVAYAPNGSIYAATNTTIWKIPYVPGAQSASGAVAIAHVRTGSVAPNSDGDVHRTTSVVATATRLYAGVGSSCNACVESDPTRATVQEMALDGSGMTTLATRARNAIALAIDPASKALWIGGAGQDGLAYGHPYEYVDSPTSHGTSRVDYGWPQCEENHRAYNALGANPAPDCSAAIAPAIEFPAYATLVGATFYPASQTGAHVFPRAYRGGLFVTSHGSWHCCPATPPRVYFVAMDGDRPVTAVNWNDPTAQSVSFLSGLGSTGSSSYIARPTGIAVGSQGSLFIADDQNGAIYRIRPSGR